MRRSGTGGARPEAGRPAKPRGLALPADLGKSLRLLDDGQLDRLTRAAARELRRRGLEVPDDPPGGRGSKKPGPAKSTRAKPEASGGASTVTTGQERLILAAHEAGLKPAAIAREFRLSRAAVQGVIAAARPARRK